MKEKIGVTDSLREEVKDNRIKVGLKNFFVKALIWLKNSNRFTRGIVLVTGQVRDELYDPATGKTIVQTYPLHVAHYNAIATAFKRALAKWIGASNAGAFIGANSLQTQASFEDKDGICETTTGYAYTTTKDSGGTGSEDYIVFKGVRTAAGSETHATLGIGISTLASAIPGTPYATQSISKSLTASQVYTVYWTITVA